MKDIGNDINICKYVGEDIFGPFIVAYCQWLNSMKKENELDKLVFCARDGYLLKQVYENLYPEDKSTIYLKVSRKALRLPYLRICDSYEDYIKIVPPFKKYKVKDFVNTLCEVNSVVLPESIAWDYEIGYECLKEDKYFQNIFYLLKAQLSRQAELQYGYFCEYMQQEGVSGKCGLIDHSYKATSQYLIDAITKNVPNLCFLGLYFDYNSIAAGRVGNHMRSFLQKTISKTDRVVLERAVLFELLIFEPAGTTVGYERGADNRIYTVSNDGEINTNKERLEPIQKYIRNYSIQIYTRDLDINVTNAVHGIIHFLKYPPRRTAQYLGELVNDDVRNGNQKLSSFGCVNRGNIKEVFNCVYEAIWRQGLIAQLPCGWILNHIYNIILEISCMKRM